MRDYQKILPETALKLLWEEVKYRHDTYWNSFFKWGSAIIIVSIIPWIKPELITQLGKLIIVFPVIAFLLSIFAAWHLLSEYARLLKVMQKYRLVQGPYQPKQISGSDLILPKFWMQPIGVVVVLTMLLGITFLSIINVILLHTLI